MALFRGLTAAALFALVGLAGACGGDDDDGDDDDPGDPGDEPDASVEPLTVVRRLPGRSEPNMWVYDPIVIEVSQPLDPASIDADALTINTSAGPVPFDLEMSEDRTTLIARITDPLPTPNNVSFALAESIRTDAGLGFAGDLWLASVPPWARSASLPAGAARPSVAVDTTGSPIVASVGTDGSAQVARLERGEWIALPAPAAGPVADLRVAIAAGDAPVAAWREDAAVRAARLDGDAWTPLAGGPDGAVAIDLASGEDGQVVVAAIGGGEVALYAVDGDALVASGPPLPVGPDAAELSLDLDGAAPVVAVADGGAVAVQRLEDGAWIEVGGGAVAAEGAFAPDLAAEGGVAAVAWRAEDGDGGRDVLVSRTDGEAGWSPVATAADLEVEDATESPALVLGADGEVTVTWVEHGEAGAVVYAARSAGDAWQFLDGALAVGASETGAVVDPVIALDPRGVPVVAWREGDGLVAARWSDSPVARAGLDLRPPPGTCAIPAETPPATLTATGCYDDVAGQVPAAELVPYSVNAPLWSDGPRKRRFLVLPAGTSATAPALGAWQVPVGTIAVKEFWLETLAGDPAARARFPVETRFLVKRCEEGDCDEPWQGYSYQWNQDGTEAQLLAGDIEERVAWPVVDPETGTAGDHTHVYPTRQGCVRCHNVAAGRLLGVQSPQLDRPGAFGLVVDDQLRAMAAIGLVKEVDPDAVVPLPQPADPSASLEGRSRAYFHGNCAQCHRPGGENATVDLRFEAPLAAENICNQITPGDGTGSTLYLRDAARGAGQMPPLATDLPDDRQLVVTADWIDSLTTCP